MSKTPIHRIMIPGDAETFIITLTPWNDNLDIRICDYSIRLVSSSYIFNSLNRLDKVRHCLEKSVRYTEAGI